MITENDTDVPGIAIVRSTRGWARTLHRYVVDHGGAVVRTRPLEERQALEDDYDILIVDDISSFLNAHIVEELHRRGRRVLGVYDPEEFSGSGDHAGRQRLSRLGVDGLIEANVSPEEFVRVIGHMAPTRAKRSPEVDLSVVGRPVAALPAESSGPGDLVHVPFKAGGDLVPAAAGQRRRGNITAVLGAGGGCGVTEVAIELARGFGRRGERTVLVDGDEVGPLLAQRLSLSLHPNLRTAVDVVEHGTGRLSECLTSVAAGLDVLVGIPHPRDWVDVRGSDVLAVLAELSRARPQIVVNVSPMIEDLTANGGVDRFGVTRALAESADHVVIVCAPTPMGVSRVIDRVAELGELIGTSPIHIVVNRAQRGAFKRNEIANEIRRSFEPASIHFLPADLRVDRAAWDGTLVPAGDFTKAVELSLVPAIPRANFALPTRKGNTGGNVRRAAKGA